MATHDSTTRLSSLFHAAADLATGMEFHSSRNLGLTLLMNFVQIYLCRQAIGKVPNLRK